MTARINRSLFVGILTALALLAGATAHANTLNVTFDGVSGSNPTLGINDPTLGSVTGYIDPYHGNIGTQNVLLWCVDPDHDAPPVGTTWTVNVATPGNLGSMGNTLQYLKAGYPSGNVSDETSIARFYGALAALVSAMENPANSVATDQELQGAIWQLSDPSLTFTNPLPSGFSVAQVTNYETWAENNALTSGFEVLTDVNEKSNLTGAYQEYIVMTPEPSTLLLMGLGLMTLFCFSRRKTICAGVIS